MATEKRLIDVYAEIRKIEDVLDERKEQAGSLTHKIFEAVKIALEKAPTVDAVEVIRCKDCKYYTEDQHGCTCDFHSQKENEDYPAFQVQMLPWDFCSYGERKYNAMQDHGHQRNL